MNGSALSASDLTSLARSSMNSSMQIPQKINDAASVEFVDKGINHPNRIALIDPVRHPIVATSAAWRSSRATRPASR